jgi:hypothetical protein
MYHFNRTFHQYLQIIESSLDSINNFFSYRERERDDALLQFLLFVHKWMQFKTVDFRFHLFVVLFECLDMCIRMEIPLTLVTFF